MAIQSRTRATTSRGRNTIGIRLTSPVDDSPLTIARTPAARPRSNRRHPELKRRSPRASDSECAAGTSAGLCQRPEFIRLEPCRGGVNRDELLLSSSSPTRDIPPLRGVGTSRWLKRVFFIPPLWAAVELCRSGIF